MPVEALTAEYSYLGDGVTTNFPFPSRFLSSADILVGVGGVQQIGGFSVAGAGDDTGGEVTFLAAPANGVKVTLIRNPPISQLVDFINGQTVLEGTLDNSLDKLTMVSQYLLRAVGRTIRVSDFSLDGPLSSLPPSETLKSKWLGFDATGRNPVGLSPPNVNVATGLADFGSLVAARLATIPGGQMFFRTAGYYSEGDGGDALYKRIAAPGVPKAWHEQIGETWWELQRDLRGINALALGAKRQAGFDSRAAIQAAIDYAVTLNCDAYLPAGVYFISAFINVPADARIRLVGDGKALTILRGLAGYAGYYIKHGKVVAAGGALSRILSLSLDQPVSGTASGIEATNANTAVYEDISYNTLALGIVLVDSFATHHVNCIGVGFASHWIYSSTKAHNLVVDRCHIFNSVGPAVRIDGPTDVISLLNSDFEYCGSVLQADNCTSVSTLGSYIEGCTNQEFYFPTKCRGFTLGNTQISLRGAVPGSGVGSQVASVYDNIEGAQVFGLTLFEQHIEWGSNVDGIDVAAAIKLDANPARSSLAPAPWRSFASFSNGWSSGGTRPAECRRNSRNEILLRGRLIAGTPNTVACAVPAGYEPPRQGRYFAAMENGAGTLLIVDTNGNVVPNQAGGGAVDIDGVIYQAAA